MLLSICVPTLGGHRRIEELMAQLMQIGRHQRKNIELVVANNVCDDLSMSWLPFRSEEFVVVVDQPRQVPFGINLESAISSASGNYVLLLGDDDIIPGSSLEPLLDLLDSRDLAHLVLQIASNQQDKALGLTPRVLFMRSGSMMGLGFRHDSDLLSDFHNYVHRNPDCLYPQVYLAMKYAAKFGVVPLITDIQVIAGKGEASVSRRFDDHMQRPSDYGIRERLDIADEVSGLFALGKWRAMSWKVTLLKWAQSIHYSLTEEGNAETAALFRDSIASSLRQEPALRLLWLMQSRRKRRGLEGQAAM